MTSVRESYNLQKVPLEKCRLDIVKWRTSVSGFLPRSGTDASMGLTMFWPEYSRNSFLLFPCNHFLSASSKLGLTRLLITSFLCNSTIRCRLRWHSRKSSWNSEVREVINSNDRVDVLPWITSKWLSPATYDLSAPEPIWTYLSFCWRHVLSIASCTPGSSSLVHGNIRRGAFCGRPPLSLFLAVFTRGATGGVEGGMCYAAPAEHIM